jgi:peptide/nickel transport system substrate-binding protein
MTRRFLATAVVVGAAALLVTASGSPRSTKEGGTFKVAVTIGTVDTIDPALVNFPPEHQLLQPACGTLMAYPDARPPAGSRLVPELAEAEPVVSKDHKVYRFTIRKDARFSDGAPVTARAFVRGLERIFTPAMKSGLAFKFEDILGARKMLAGKVTTLAGAIAKGRTLTLRLTKPVPLLLDFLATEPGLCAVPPNLPANPEGADAPLSSAGPYYFSEYTPGERLVLQRNRFYKGERPHHITRFVANLAVDPGSGVEQVASGAFDTVTPRVFPEQQAELAKRYGINKSQYWVTASFFLREFILSRDRGLFRNNVKLRQAVNFAVDRKALVREGGPGGGTPTDQYLLPAVSGYKDERIYPLKGPDLRRAKALAKGNTRGGKAVLYTIDLPRDVAEAQILKQNLKAIGIEVEVRAFPVTLYFQKVRTPGEPWDLARIQQGGFRDPAYLNDWFPELPKYNRLLYRASRLTGEARYRAYGELDVQISSEVAPEVPISTVNWPTFVSPRVGCVVNPMLDLTAVCLK